jgi:hypothetical protein
MLESNLLRVFIMAQLSFSVACLVIIATMKKTYYTAHKFAINMILIGMILFATSGFVGMSERMGTPITSRTWTLFGGAAFTNIGCFLALWKSKLKP